MEILKTSTIHINTARVVLFFRAKTDFRYSIENVFDTLWPYLNDKALVDKVHLPLSGASPRTLLINILASRKKVGIRHISGDVHYLGLYAGNRTILTIHDIGSLSHKSTIKQLYIKLFWLWLPCLVVKKITVISEFSKKELMSAMPLITKKIVVISNPVNQRFIYEPKEALSRVPTILCVGTKSNKNLERVIQSVEGIDCELNIIGRLSQHQLGLLHEHKVRFINSYSISEDEIHSAYKRCDLLCFVSTYEGFGMPIVEAQSVGRPVVTSDCGAMKEVARSSALLVNPFSVDSIREGILKVIKDDNLRKTLVLSGQKNVQRFAPERIAQKYSDLYNDYFLK